MDEDVVEPDGYYTGNWSVFHHQCLECGMNLATVCPEPDTPILLTCSECRKRRMERARAEEACEEVGG